MLTEKSKALCLTPGITTLLSFGIGWSGAAINLCPGHYHSFVFVHLRGAKHCLAIYVTPRCIQYNSNFIRKAQIFIQILIFTLFFFPLTLYAKQG